MRRMDGATSGQRESMITADTGHLDLADAWIASDPHARWRSAMGLGPALGTRRSGTSVLEVPPGHCLPRHVDTAEETIVVLRGTAEVHVGDEAAEVPAGGMALVPEAVPHEVRNAGRQTLRFLALYASTDVTTRYEDEVQPDGSSERRPLD
jgi:mannose-6-phosphate isomerase-like protein (cupin superfamily)